MVGNFRIGKKQQKSKMATLDDSPSLFSGQQWTDWANTVLPGLEMVVDADDTVDDNTVADSMKLKIEDMPLFGLCPSRDEFYLVVCDKCNQVLKPQAFQAHLDVRHAGKGGYHPAPSSSSSKLHQSSSRHSSSRSHSTKSPSKSHRSHAKSHSSHGKMTSHSEHSRIPKLSPEKPQYSSHSKPGHMVKEKEDVSVVEEVDRHSGTSKVSACEPPHSFNDAEKVGADTSHHKGKDSKLKKNHSLPVVKVERMPETLAMKKQRESGNNARTSLSNGAIRGSRSSPVSLTQEPDNIAVPHNVSPPPALSVPHSPVAEPALIEPLLDLNDLSSEIDSAVSAILEPFSPAMEEEETSSFLSLATSASTLTTNTVTMATLTMTSPAVTTATNTTSSFTFSSTGRPHFPSGSIRVNFSSTGVLTPLTSSANTNNNNVVKSSTQPAEDFNKTSVCSNGSIESTISDIVKSTVNTSNMGLGFKKLSPFSSPVKSSSVSSVLNNDNSLKSPTGISNILKSASATNSSSKLGTKLTLGPGTMYRSLSFGGVPPVTSSQSSTTSPASSASTSPASVASVDALKKLQLMNKPDKIIPLKDREYDANKHCGVVVSETGKACTRSLTCKTHALSLRRAVTGRRLPFDELLKEHREAKEAYMKAKTESKEAAAALKAAQGQKPGSVALSPLGKSGSMTGLASPPQMKQSPHVTQGAHKAESRSLPSTPVPVVGPGTKQQLLPQKSVSLTLQRSISSLSGSLSQEEEEGSGGSKCGEKMEESEDDSYTPYHPRPIAACSFGARYHNNYGSGFGCHTFGRKTDHLRAAFLDLLEKHINPPPTKKLCVEASLPKEPDGVFRSTDPYEFFQDGTKTSAVVNQVSVVNPVIGVTNKTVSPKAKFKTSGSISNSVVMGINKPKHKDNVHLVGSKSSGLNISAGMSHGLVANSSAKKRRSSGSGGSVSQSAVNLQSPGLAATLVTAPSLVASVGALTNSGATGSPQFAIAIPNVNLSSATLNQINASLVNSASLKHNKNNVMKDMSFVVTGISQEALLNGQYVNITNAQMAQQQDTANNPVVNEESVTKPVQQVQQIQQAHVIANSKPVASQPKFINSINSIDAIRALQAGKGNILTSLPPNTLLLDGTTVLQPVSLTTPSTQHNATTALSNHAFTATSQANTPSQFPRSGSASPQVTVTSPAPNGVITSFTDNDLLLSHHQVFQSKTVPQSQRIQTQQQHQQQQQQQQPVQQPVQQQQQQPQQRGTIQQASHLFSGAQLQPHNFRFQTPTTSITNQINTNASQVLTQFQVKNSNIQKAGTINKLTMQPMSLTIPFVSPSSVGTLGLGGQQQTQAFFITSDEAQKQGIHLQQPDSATQNSSPSNSIIS